MAEDSFASKGASIESAALGAFAITPSDGTDLTTPIRAITINVAGTVSFVSTRGETAGVTQTTSTLPAGTYAIFASRILATGTTATEITGWI